MRGNVIRYKMIIDINIGFIINEFLWGRYGAGGSVKVQKSHRVEMQINIHLINSGEFVPLEVRRESNKAAAVNYLVSTRHRQDHHHQSDEKDYIPHLFHPER